ncbi:hypothetical protein ACNAN0_10045 [Agrilactobacillus fermenti]|nr:hypothetical protein [Agrilactobacillus fermenti]MCD2255995.1 hypothetical protein [Agrilactobacillus fermenti]
MKHPAIYYLSYLCLFFVLIALLVIVYHLFIMVSQQLPYTFEMHFGGR